MRNSAKIKPLLIPMLLIALILISFGSVLAAANDGPVITIPSNISAQANSVVEIPISYGSAGESVTSMIFSIDYDETKLEYDPLVINAIVFTNIPDNYSKSCSFDASDTDGELDCNIIGIGSDLDPMPDGKFLTIKLKTLNAPDGSIAPVGFSSDPLPSLGSSSGTSVAGTWTNGSVYFGELTWYVYLPLVLRMTPIPTTVTPTPETPTPTPDTPTPTTETPTLTPTPSPGCSDIILNGGFEEADVAWYIPTTNYPAKYTTSVFHTGAASMRTGINLADNVYSYSSAWQPITIPNDAISAELTFYYKPQTSESIVSRLISNLINFSYDPFEDVESDPFRDQQMALVLNEDTSHNTTLMSILSNSQTWTESESYTLMNYKGKTVWVAFTTYNDGFNGKTAMYVDDVVVEVCK